MGAAVRDGGTGRADAALNEAAPEQLLRRTDDRGEPCGDLGLRPERPQGVDISDLLRTFRHDRTRHPISGPEEAVEAYRGKETERGVPAVEAHLSQYGLDSQDHVAG